ncbi:unnamed protein product [Discula destructiva]
MKSFSNETSGASYNSLSKLPAILKACSGTEVEFDARVHAIRHREPDSDSVILLLRDEGLFLAITITKCDIGSGAFWEAAQTCTVESVLRIRGSKICGDDDGDSHVGNVTRLVILALAVENLPKRVSHGGPGETETPTTCSLTLQERLDNRVLDVRVAATASIFKLLSGMIELSVEYCIMNGFQWTPTPVLINYNLPGDDDYFPVSYMGGQPAWLAQTAELHQQMVVSMDIPKVFEIRTNLRAEKNVTKRRLTEFTAVEVTMTIDHWTEILDTSEALLVFVISGLHDRQKYRDAIEATKRLYPSAGSFRLGFDKDGRLPRLTFSEAKLLLQEHHIVDTQNGLESDMTADEEAALGRLMRDTYGTDAFILTDYPARLRPYTYTPSSSMHNGTNSFDFIARGEEVATCFQSISDKTELRAAMGEHTDPDAPMWQPYFAAFDAAVKPHGGFAFGLNRLLKAFLGLDDVHETVIFPRDAGRLAP